MAVTKKTRTKARKSKTRAINNTESVRQTERHQSNDSYADELRRPDTRILDEHFNSARADLGGEKQNKVTNEVSVSDGKNPDTSIHQ